MFLENVIGVILILLVVFFFFFWQKEVISRRCKQEHELAEHKRKQLLDTQENIGNRIFNSLTVSAYNNYGSPVKVQRIRDNGGAYCIFIGWEESTCCTLGGLDYRGYPIVGITVRLSEGLPITVSYGPYPDARKGTEVYYDTSEQQIKMLLDVVGRHITTYSPYENA